MGIVLKSAAEIARMREAGRIVHQVLEAVEAACVPGVTTAELDAIARRVLRRARARSCFLGYAPGGVRPYPAVLCTSVNEVVVHGIPSSRQVLAEGDIVGIDFACSSGGYCADAARTIAVGIVSAAARALIAATREALERAIATCVLGKRLGDVGAAVRQHVEARGCSVVRDLVGHGIGRTMHEPPDVPNYGSAGRGLRLVPGLVFTIEPMVNAGGPAVRVLPDGWTVVSADRSLSAHVEHTIAVTEEGPLVLTTA